MSSNSTRVRASRSAPIVLDQVPVDLAQEDAGHKRNELVLSSREAQPKLKILLASRGVVPVGPGCGGAELVIYHLAQALRQADHEVTVIADSDEETVASLRGVRMRFLDSPILRGARRLRPGFVPWLLQHLIGNIVVASRVRQLLNQEQFDVIHCHGSLSALLLSFKTRRAGVPLVYTEHDATPWSCRYRNPIERLIRRVIYRIINGAALHRADKVVTNFEELGQEIQQRWDINNVECIRNGTDLGIFRPLPAGTAGIEEDVPFERYCLFVGSLISRKSPDLLLRAVAEAGDMPCVIAGDGGLRSRLERQARDLNIDRKVMFLGNVPRHSLRRLYAKADMLILPSVSEGAPLVVLEAMACGTPVIATRIAGLPSLVTDWENGFLVKPGDVGQLAMAIRFLAGDGRLRKRMARAARRRAESEFPWASIVEQYVRLYRGLAQHSKKQVPASFQSGRELQSEIVL